MKDFVVRRVTFLQGLALVLLGFGLGVGSITLGFICLAVSVALDALNGFLQSRRK